MQNMPCYNYFIISERSVETKMPLEFLFGKKKTPEEMLRQNQRALTKAMRDLDRERSKMEQQEKKVIADIKKMAKQGQMVCFIRCLLEYINRTFGEKRCHLQKGALFGDKCCRPWSDAACESWRLIRAFDVCCFSDHFCRSLCSLTINTITNV